MKRKMQTRYNTVLPKHDALKMTPSDILKTALQEEYECLQHSALSATRRNEPRYYMLDNDPKCSYRTKPLDIMPTSHCGQLKLFLSELWFLTRFYEEGKTQTLVYAGAASGQHIALLAELFPKVDFILYDSRPFDKSLLEHTNVYIQQKLFTNEDAALYANQNILFVSDIRSGDPFDPNCVNFETCVDNDMKMQKEWVLILKPFCSMLKVRWPYAEGTSSYFLGQLRYGIFAPQSTTELRLIVRDFTLETIYDHTDIEEKSYYFNNFTRTNRYHSFFPEDCQMDWNSIGIDFCWDCCAFLRVCMDFLRISTQEESLQLFEFVQKCIMKCGAKKKLKRSPHGDDFEQWNSIRHEYNGTDIYSHGYTKLIDTKVVDFIHRVYSENASIAPPLGCYCGPVSKKLSMTIS